MFINFVKELSEINNQNDSKIDELKKAKMQNGDSVEDNLVALIAKIGEKITIGKTKTISNSSSINYQYLHTVVKDNLAKLAVIVSLETLEHMSENDGDEFLRKILDSMVLSEYLDKYAETGKITCTCPAHKYRGKCKHASIAFGE